MLKVVVCDKTTAEVYVGKYRILFHHGKIICADTFTGRKRTIYLDERYWEYSHTTCKRRCDFLNLDKKTMTKMANNNEIYLIKDDLNTGWFQQEFNVGLSLDIK